ncbi:MAG: hypothetical protein ACYTGN_06650 [Planctomycetota bacterium]|jgi:hypothetical protein
MKSAVDGLLKVRRGPRPDPIPDARYDAWSLHAPYLTLLITLLVAGMLLTDGERGLLACGAVIGAALRAMVQLRLREGSVVVHYGAGVLVVALFLGMDGAGAYTLPACLFLTAALGARAATRYFSLEVAPLAGRVQWRFSDAFRRQSVYFGIAGGAAALVGIVIAPGTAAKVLSVAMLPLVLRTYMGQMLAPDARTRLWTIAASFELIALLLLVPASGIGAAPWIVVAGETVLFLGSAIVILERTGVRIARRDLGIGTGTFLLVASVALPGAPAVLPVLVLVLAAVVWIVWTRVPGA